MYRFEVGRRKTGLSRAGLVIVIPNVTPARQRDLFTGVLTHVEGRDLINAVVEADFSAGQLLAASMHILTAEPAYKASTMVVFSGIQP
jgi:hypothetical protein